MAQHVVERRHVDHKKSRYPSDLNDAEWEIVAPVMPPAKRGGRPRMVNIREVPNGIFHVLSTGCQWRAVPKCTERGSILYLAPIARRYKIKN